MHNLNLSILIVTYNSEKYIYRCLQSLHSQTSNNINYDVLVIDNASCDNTVNIIRNNFPDVKCIQNTENLGYAKAVNIGVNNLSGEYVLLLNPDVILYNDFFTKLEHFLKEKERYKFSVLGVKLIDEKGKTQPSCWKRVTIFTIIAEMLLPYQISKFLVTVSPDELTEVENVSGACMLVVKKDFETLSGFDTNFFLYYEEIDFCLRARKELNLKVLYNPYIEVIHYGMKSTAGDKGIFFHHLFKSKLYFIKKHFSKTFYSVSFIIVLVGILLRSIIAFLAGIFSVNKNLIKTSRSLIFILIKLLKR